jgi:hypothetical protein
MNPRDVTNRRLSGLLEGESPRAGGVPVSVKQERILKKPPVPPKSGGQEAVQLEKDQLWKVNDGYVLIVGMGKSLVHYKFLKMKGQRSAPLRMIAREQLESYLKNSHSTIDTEKQQAA